MDVKPDICSTLQQWLLNDHRDSLGEAIEAHESGEGYNFPDDKKRELVALLHDLKSLWELDGLLWINPVAVTVPVKPSDFRAVPDNNIFEQAIHFASWLPISCCVIESESLLNAYLEANYSKVDPSHHITPHILACLEEGFLDEVFLAELSATHDGRVVVKELGKTSRPGSRLPISFRGNHYRKLFTLSNAATCDSVYFLPHRTLSPRPLPAELSFKGKNKIFPSMYRHFMVGSYIGVLHTETRSFPSDLVRTLSDHLSLLMYLKARHKAQNYLWDKLRLQTTRLEKYEKMYSLLLSPLRSLTEALKTTQADAQELRAILYDPWEAIFECQPQIAALFEEGKTLPDGTKIEHKPRSYKEYTTAARVFSHALARFRGEDSPVGARKCHVSQLPCAQESLLCGELGYLKRAEIEPHNSYHQVAAAVLHVVRNEPLQKFQSWGELCEALAQSEARNKLHLVVGCLDRLKDRFLTPYKPSIACEPLRWNVLEAFLAGTGNVTFEAANINQNLMEIGASDFPIVTVKNGQPLTTHGHLIEFICGVIQQHVKESESRIDVSIEIRNCRPNPEFPTHIDCTSATYTSCKFITTGEGNWINTSDRNKRHADDELLRVCNEELENRKSRVRGIGEHGNFYKPFVKLIRRLPDDTVAQAGIDLEMGGALIIDLRSIRFSFTGKVFKMVSTAHLQT